MVLKNSSYQEWTKSNQTIKIKPWKSKDLEDLEIKQSIKQSNLGKLEEIKQSNIESCKIWKVGRNQTIKHWKLEDLGIKQSKLESLKSNNQTLKVGRFGKLKDWRILKVVS